MTKGVLIGILFSFTFAGYVRAQVDFLEEESIVPNLHPLDGSVLDEETTVSFIIDNTKTKLGSDFYEEFYKTWMTLVQDTTAALPREALAEQEISIEIEELPYPGLTGIIGIKLDREFIWQQFLQLRGEAKEMQASGAALFLFQYLINYEAVRQELSSDDQSGTGIY